MSSSGSPLDACVEAERASDTSCAPVLYDPPDDLSGEGALNGTPNYAQAC